MNALKIFFVLFVALISIQNTNAQFINANNPDNDVLNFSPELQEKILATGLALALEGFEIGDTYTTKIKQGTPSYFYRDFFEGNDYVVIAISENGIQDLDLLLMDKQGKHLAKDDRADDEGVAIAEKRIFRDGLVQIKVTNYASDSKFDSYDAVVIVAYRDN